MLLAYSLSADCIEWWGRVIKRNVGRLPFTLVERLYLMHVFSYYKELEKIVLMNLFLLV